MNSTDKIQKILNEIESPLNKTIKELKLIAELTEKFGAAQVGIKLIQKDIEDGMITGLSNASIQQLERMINSSQNFFSYYGKEYGDKLIKSEIKRKIRLHKLNKIMKDNE